MEVKFAISVKTGPGAHLSSYTIGTGSLLPGVKRPGRDINHNPGPRLKKEYSDTSTPPLGLRGLFSGEAYLYQRRYSSVKRHTHYNVITADLTSDILVEDLSPHEVDKGKESSVIHNNLPMLPELTGEHMYKFPCVSYSLMMALTGESKHVA